MTQDTYLLYLAAVAVFFAKPPGPSQLLMMANALRHGTRRSYWTLAGDLSANSLQMAAAGFGLAALVALSGDVVVWVKWAGVVYLLWMGIRLFRAPPVGDVPQSAPRVAAGRLFRQGFLTSAANPYAIVFFGALFPQFIDPTAPIMAQVAILGVTYLVVDGIMLLVWATVAQQTLGRLGGLGGRWINRVSGGLLIGAAALLASRDLTGVAK